MASRALTEPVPTREGTPGYSLAERALIPDDTGRIARTLTEWADNDRADLILTTGGTG